MIGRDYYRSIFQLISTARVVTGHQIEFDEQDTYVAYLSGSARFIDGSILFFAQYVRIEGSNKDSIHREKYRYHWQAQGGETRYR